MSNGGIADQKSHPDEALRQGQGEGHNAMTVWVHQTAGTNLIGSHMFAPVIKSLKCESIGPCNRPIECAFLFRSMFHNHSRLISRRVPSAEPALHPLFANRFSLEFSGLLSVHLPENESRLDVLPQHKLSGPTLT